ncbi:MAG: cold-shock protein [Sphingomonas bacterium]|jgi:uncharacterized membrane protein YsdA (DUF1294 family)|nr:DUF1294 domain-containing protein [Sphingomonas bacterium]MDB5690020.1 cold-shock protein [Sphingomonas bacterium]
MAALILAWLVVVNGWTFARFGMDKQRAVAGLRRIPESDLLGLCLIGGTIGAYAGRHRFRHKTRKQPFSTYLHLIAVLQSGGLIGWAAAGIAA